MKNKIKQFAKGNFQISRPEIYFPQTHLELLIGEGEIYQSSFRIENRLDGDIRGLVYPSSFRINCVESGFEGASVEVHFTYDGRGLEPGFVERGTFTVVTNGGEYELTFTAIVEKPFVMTSCGKVQSLKEFRELAYQDFGEAHHLFRSRAFYDVLKYEEKWIYSLYDNMRKWSLSEQALEEFLVGTKQKERIFLSFQEEEREFENILEATKDEIHLEKNTWGHLTAYVRVEGKFLKVARSQIVIDDFVGNQCSLPYIIEEDGLHQGYNYGRIYVDTPYEEICCEITVHQALLNPRKEREEEFILAQTLKGYLGVEAGRMEKSIWAEEAVNSFQKLRELAPEQEIYQLMLAHVYLIGEKREEARWLLEHYNYKKSDLGHTPDRALYYLYLMLFLNPEEEQRRKVTEEMRRLHTKFPHNWRIAMMLIETDSVYENTSAKIRMMERQFENGAHSLMFYLQAFRYLKERPDCLKQLNTFEIQVVNFAVKYQICGEEMAVQTAELACQKKNFDESLYRLLVKCYKKYHTPAILQAICVQLIKGQHMESCYHIWFEKAIEEELKIAQLYEYYMFSLEEKRVNGKLPRTIYLYFLHGNTLNDRKAALLYANIITYEPEDSSVYESYRERIEAFAWNQLEKRRISEELRIIYRRFFTEEGMTPKRMEALYDICHAYLVTTTQPGMKYVLVLEADGTISQRTAYDREDGAIVFLKQKDSRIVWEGQNGWHYADSIPFESIRLFYEQKFLELSRHYNDTTQVEGRERKGRELSFENLRKYGMEQYEEENVFCICSKRIREENYEEDDFLSYLCYTLFELGQYDKVTLTYLANFYCGPTEHMKDLWYAAKQYEVNTKKLAERIITQMLFSEAMYHEEKIFQDYYDGVPYFRIKQAYLAFVSREYVLRDRMVDQCVFQIIEDEYGAEEELADICKIALLKRYSGENLAGREEKLFGWLREMRMKGLVFPFYLTYPEAWLREVQLFDKILIQYKAKHADSRVKLHYQIVRDEQEGVGFEAEILIPTYENIYVKEFTLYKDERLRYYFRETAADGSTTTEKRSYVKRKWAHAGKYGKLNEISLLPQEKRKEAMQSYALEDALADKLFQVY